MNVWCKLNLNNWGVWPRTWDHLWFILLSWPGSAEVLRQQVLTAAEVVVQRRDDWLDVKLTGEGWSSRATQTVRATTGLQRWRLPPLRQKQQKTAVTAQNKSERNKNPITQLPRISPSILIISKNAKYLLVPSSQIGGFTSSHMIANKLF